MIYEGLCGSMVEWFGVLPKNLLIKNANIRMAKMILITANNPPSAVCRRTGDSPISIGCNKSNMKSNGFNTGFNRVANMIPNTNNITNRPANMEPKLMVNLFTELGFVTEPVDGGCTVDTFVVPDPALYIIYIIYHTHVHIHNTEMICESIV